MEERLKEAVNWQEIANRVLALECRVDVNSQYFARIGAKVEKGEFESILFELGKKAADLKRDREKTGNSPASANYFSMLFKPFKDKFGLGPDHTLYSWKHTRAIHLIQDGVQPYELMKMFRHSDLATTSLYLRDLGLTVDGDAINSKTRKF